MAELDISGFVTPEQQFAGLYKFGETLAAQQAAKRKDAQEKDAKKKLLNKVVSTLDPKDYITNTIEDGHITGQIYDIMNDGYDFVSKNPGTDESDLQNYLANRVKNVAISSQNIKEKKRQIDAGWEELKNNPSADRQKYYTEANKIFQNTDGTVKEDLTKIDPSENDVINIMANGDIWNMGGFYKVADEYNKSSIQKEGVKVAKRDKQGLTKTMSGTLAHSDLYEPVTDGVDEQGFPIFTGDFKQKGMRYATEDGKIKQVPKLDALGNPEIDPKTKQPIMEDQALIGDEAWNKFSTDTRTAGLINSMLNKYAKENGVLPNSANAINGVKNQIYKLVESSPQKKEFVQSVSELERLKGSGGKGSGGAGGEFYDFVGSIKNQFDQGEKSYGSGYNLHGNMLNPAEGAALAKIINGRETGADYRASELTILKNAAGNYQVVSNRLGDKLKILMPLEESGNIPAQFSKEAKSTGVTRATKVAKKDISKQHKLETPPKSKSKKTKESGEFDDY